MRSEKHLKMAQLKFSNKILYPPLRTYEGLIGKLPLVNPFIYLGLEVEAEQVADKYNPNDIPGSWNVTDDGSLKEYGMEFVSRPIRFKYIEMELRRLFGAIPKAVFSPRTSIHVHMNSRDFTNDELLKFLILYLIFERNLYSFAGNRWLNNFCIPLHSNSHLVRDILSLCVTDKLLNSLPWCKYHGLNLLPLVGEEGSSNRYGTIEFRQMIGTNNIEYIIDWCNLIVCLKLAAKKFSSKELLQILMENQCTSQQFINSVFGEWSNKLNLNNSDNLSKLKESILGTKIICLDSLIYKV